MKKLVWFLFLLVLLGFPRISAPSGVGNLKMLSNNWPDTSTLKDFGERSIRIFQAKSNEEKAIAVWRSIQHLTVATDVIPKEPALGVNYVVDPMKLLNVYGGHWCDGLSRMMEMTWRSLGYRAQKLYKFGHTFADCHWKDSDGVERWHVFDLNQP